MYYWFQVAMQPSLDDEGRVAGWYGLHTNIEDLIRAQESVQRLQSKLALANQIATASELAASVVHEISQPISVMVTNAQVSLNLLTRDSPDAAGVLPVLRRIVEDGKTTAGIVTVLNSLFYQGKQERAPIALQEITEKVLGLLRGRIGRAGVMLRRQVPADLPPVNGSRIAIQQVMLNLLTNALDAFKTPAQHKTLAIASYFDEQTVTISVTDPGTRPASYDSIFKPFFTTKAKGKGLGLSIARSIIEAHEGTLRAGPAASGPGSIFAFTLRRAGVREPS